MSCRPIFWIWISLLAFVTKAGLWAQTNPAPQLLPYAQDFGATTFNTMPAGLAAWTGLSGASVSSQSAAAASAPSSDATVGTATTAQSTGGSYGYATSSNARYYVQTSSNTSGGVNQLALALNTTGWGSLTLSYDVEIISAQPRTVGLLCQYRVGTSGAWTTLSGTGNPYSQAAGTTGVMASPHVTLPPATENQPVVQIRWATWRGTESGNSSGVAVDNIAVSGTSIAGGLTAAVSPGTVSEAAGANATTLTVTRSGDTTAALPVTLVINNPTKAAYDGPNPQSIPAGQTSITFPIRTIDDDGFSGTAAVTFTVSAPGVTSGQTTLQVTDDEDANSPPAGYYAGAAGKSGDTLKAALKGIASPANYHQYAYSDTYNPLRDIDEDPNNSSNVLLVYSGGSLGKTVNYFPGGPSPDVSWSREHVWPESYGLDPDNVNPGSSGGDAGPDFTDLFNLRPCLQTVNQQRSNKFYDHSSGSTTTPPLAPLCSYDSDSWEPRDSEKGDLARTIFYMATRYDGTEALTMDLEVAETANSSLARFAKLSTLLRWNEEDPVSPEERLRNQKIFANYQHNRNPFIDHPEYAAQIWGGLTESKAAATVTEGGAGDSYTLRLASQPTATVTITLSALPAGQVNFSPPTLTFTTANWDQPQTVTLTAVNDNTHEDTLIASVHHALSSADTRYAALVPVDIAVTVIDNDVAAAVLLSYGGPWDSLPAGFTSTGLGTYATELGGDAGNGSAKFDGAGDQLTIAFNAAPGTLTYQLKGNPSSGSATSGTFLVQTSVDGTNFTTLRTVTDKDNTDAAFSDELPDTARSLRFLYSVKNGGNIQLDKLVLNAAAATVPPFQSWAAGYSLNGANADALTDYDHDGYVNLAEYALGRSPIGADSAGQQPAVQVVSGKLRITAVVRTSDAALTVSAQHTSTITNAASWTSSGISSVSGVDQTGVAAGFARVTFEVSSPATPLEVMRLVFGLN